MRERAGCFQLSSDAPVDGDIGLRDFKKVLVLVSKRRWSVQYAESFLWRVRAKVDVRFSISQCIACKRVRVSITKMAAKTVTRLVRDLGSPL